MQLNKQILNEISRQITSKSFHKTELYKVLRDELLSIGNWKAKSRGKPDVNNFKNIDVGISNAFDGVPVRIVTDNRTLDKQTGVVYYD